MDSFILKKITRAPTRELPDSSGMGIINDRAYPSASFPIVIMAMKNARQFKHVDEYCFVQGKMRCDKFIKFLDGISLDVNDFYRKSAAIEDAMRNATSDQIVFNWTRSRGIMDFETINNIRDSEMMTIASRDQVVPPGPSRVKFSTIDKIDAVSFNDRGMPVFDVTNPYRRDVDHFPISVSNHFFRNLIIDNWIDNDKKIFLAPWNNSMAMQFMAEKPVKDDDADAVTLMKVFFDLSPKIAFESGIWNRGNPNRKMILRKKWKARTISRDSYQGTQRVEEFDTHVLEKLVKDLKKEPIVRGPMTETMKEIIGTDFSFVESRPATASLPLLGMSMSLMDGNQIKGAVISRLIDKGFKSWDKVFYSSDEQTREIARSKLARGEFTSMKSSNFRPIITSMETAIMKGKANEGDWNLLKTAKGILSSMVSSEIRDAQEKRDKYHAKHGG